MEDDFYPGNWQDQRLDTPSAPAFHPMRQAFYALILTLAGCATMQPPVHDIAAPFDQAEADRLAADGPNTVKGNAFMRQQGGGVVTCAGQEVYLVPATAYAVERMKIIYGNTDSGVGQFSNRVFTPEPYGYKTTGKTGRCDSQGNFTIEKVADGDFFATTAVVWQVGYVRQGGFLMQRLQVKGGQVKSIVMAP